MAKIFAFAIPFVIVVVLAMLLRFSYLAGHRIGFAKKVRVELAPLGISKRTFQRHEDAITLLSRIIRATELDGEFAGNILTEKTQKEMEKIVDDYRAEKGIG